MRPVDCLTIMGGEGVFWIGLSAGKYEQLRLFELANGTHEVQVWTSDQGFADQEQHVTYDSELVLLSTSLKPVNHYRTQSGSLYEPTSTFAFK